MQKCVGNSPNMAFLKNNQDDSGKIAELIKEKNDLQ